MIFHVSGVVMSGGIKSTINCTSCGLETTNVGDWIPVHGASVEPLIPSQHTLVVIYITTCASFNQKVVIGLLDILLWAQETDGEVRHI